MKNTKIIKNKNKIFFIMQLRIIINYNINKCYLVNLVKC